MMTVDNEEGGGEDERLQGLSSWGDQFAAIGIFGRETSLEKRESLRRFGSNCALPPSSESGQWGWQKKKSSNGENSDL